MGAGDDGGPVQLGLRAFTEADTLPLRMCGRTRRCRVKENRPKEDL